MHVPRMKKLSGVGRGQVSQSVPLNDDFTDPLNGISSPGIWERKNRENIDGKRNGSNSRNAKPSVPSTKFTKPLNTPRTPLSANSNMWKIAANMPWIVSRTDSKTCAIPDATPIFAVGFLVLGCWWMGFWVMGCWMMSDWPLVTTCDVYWD